jgi:hypothetical protein
MPSWFIPGDPCQLMPKIGGRGQGHCLAWPIVHLRMKCKTLASMRAALEAEKMTASIQQSFTFVIETP